MASRRELCLEDKRSISDFGWSGFQYIEELLGANPPLLAESLEMVKHIRLYQIPWSHYCDKVRWALDLTGIPYELINYNIPGKTEGLQRAPKTLRKLMPIIEDPNNQDHPFQCDSTPILLYLNDRYLQSSRPLFPSSSEQRQSVIDMCLRLDSELGLYARRLTYVQLLQEKTSAISILVGEKFSWAYNPDDIRSRLVSPFVACLMISRYRLHRIREEHLREKTESLLLEFSDHLQTHDYLVGEHFSAADLTFCSLIKPLTNVPFFSDNRRFRSIFDYHERIRRKHDPKYPNIDNFVEKLADEHRQRVKKNKNRLSTRVKGFIHPYNFIGKFFFWIMTMFVSRMFGPDSDEQEVPQFTTSNNEQQRQEAVNDQREVKKKSTWLMIMFFFKYLCHLMFTIPNQAAYLNGET